MPVLKQQFARPAMKEAIVLDLSDIGAQAERLKRDAENRAKQIVADAEQQAQQLVAGAEAKGFEQGQAAGLAAGREQGKAEGYTQALADAGERLTQMAEAWQQALMSWEDQANALRLDARRDVLEFALRLTEKVVHRVIEVDPTVVVDQVEQALSYVLQPMDVTVRVHPDDMQLLVEALPELQASFTNVQHIELKSDERMTPGGCTLGFGQGAVDATIEKQLARLVDLILPGEGGQDSAGRRQESGADVVDAEDDHAAPDNLGDSDAADS